MRVPDTRLVLADALCIAADAFSWAGDKLLVPVLTGVAVGLALRGAAIPREVADHDAQAEEVNTDLIRWVRDRGRTLRAEIFHALNMARQGIIEDVAEPWVPASDGEDEAGS
jgi:hypothetical protein